MMRRRVALGLADPLVGNRFLLWSIWTGATGALPLFVITMRAVALAQGAPEDPMSGVSGEAPIQSGDPVLQAALAVIAVAGASSIVALWLCFFPPRAYVSWIRGSQIEGEA